MYFHEKIFETADAIVTPMTGWVISSIWLFFYAVLNCTTSYGAFSLWKSHYHLQCD
jgi:hypothetical protein